MIAYIVVIFAPTRKLFSAKSTQFPNIYEIKSNDGHFSSRTVITHFQDKLYQNINSKSH